MKKTTNLILTILIPVIIWAIPTSSIPIEGLTLMEHRVMAIFSFAVLSWILEPIPIFATSVLIIFLEIFTLSNGGLIPFKKTVSEITFNNAQTEMITLIAKENKISENLAQTQFEAYLKAKKENKELTLVSSLEQANNIDLKEQSTHKLIEEEKAYCKVVKAHKKNNAGLIPYASIMNNFAHRIIMLFLGGFFLAAAATKYRLDTNLARILVKPFGTKPALVTLGIMLITAVFLHVHVQHSLYSNDARRCRTDSQNNEKYRQRAYRHGTQCSICCQHRWYGHTNRYTTKRRCHEVPHR